MIREEELLEAVSDALRRDQLKMPTLPEVAMRVSRVSQDQKVTAVKLAAEIGHDPALAIRVLRVANSAAFGRGRRIDSLQLAVTRLGIDLLRNLVTGLALDQLFFSRSPVLKERLRRSWEHSVEVAALAQVVSSRCPGLRQEMALLAGLTHEIGALPIIGMLEEMQEDPPDAEVLDRVLISLQPQVGKMVLQSWDMPIDLEDVPLNWSDFDRDHEGSADYIDVVTVAALQSHQHRKGRFALVDRTAVPAFLKLDIAPEVDVFELEGVQEGFDENYSALMN